MQVVKSCRKIWSESKKGLHLQRRWANHPPCQMPIMNFYRLYAYNPLLLDYEPISLPMRLSEAWLAKKRAEHGNLYSSVKVVRYTGNQLNFMES